MVFWLAIVQKYNVQIFKITNCTNFTKTSNLVPNLIGNHIFIYKICT